MTLHVFSLQHDRQGLSEVERIASGIDEAVTQLRKSSAVAGSVVLSTCNRVEVLLDTDEPGAADLRTVLNAQFDTPPAWDLYLGEAALGHLFRVAAGLESMVVGEREIAGQLKRALTDAREAGESTHMLNIAIDDALRTSRRVSHETALEGAGRSVVSEGLDLLEVADWAKLSVLIVGTGAYAGAVLAALRRRGVANIAVHSASGRGERFAASHDVAHQPDLEAGIATADLIVTCRGRGGHVITPQLLSEVAGPKIFLDLSLARDVDPEVGQREQTQLIDLARIQEALGSGIDEDTRRAGAIVNEGIAETLTKLRVRAIDPAVVGLRESVMALVDDEVARLPQRELTHEDAARSLRRLATRLLHVPSTRARLAAEQGRTAEYLRAMEHLYGIGEQSGIDADTLEQDVCPVTHLGVSDLEHS